MPKEKIADMIEACDAGLAVLKKLDIFKTFIRIRSLTIWLVQGPSSSQSTVPRAILWYKGTRGCILRTENPHDLKEKILFSPVTARRAKSWVAMDVRL